MTNLMAGGRGKSVFRRGFDLLFRWRWAIALGVWVLCVLFEVSGTSLSCLALLAGGESDIALGAAREFRTDEWAVFTPMALSQAVSDGGSFSYAQDVLRGVPTDMFCVYGQAVADPVVIFHPFQMGYLLLGPTRGLSFYWCGRLICLFMVSLEFAYRVLPGRSRALSIAFGLMVALSPWVQWWFSVNCLVEMLLFGQLALIWARSYLRMRRYGVRVLLALGIAWCLGCFILTMYPAWQVPLAWIFLALLVGLLWQELPRAKLGWHDIAITAGGLLLAIGATAYVLAFKSADTVAAVMGTTYPGHRASVGGGAGALYFQYPFMLLAPFADGLIQPNACEIATTFNLFPLSIVLPLYGLLRFRRHRRAATSSTFRLLVPLLVVTTLLIVYAVVKLPEPVANATLLGRSTSQRVCQASTFALLMMLFASLPLLRDAPRRTLALLTAGSWFALCLGAWLWGQPWVSHRITAILLLATLVLMALAAFAASQRGRAAFAAGCLAVSLISGATVNPVALGIDGFLQSPGYLGLQQADNGGLWASVGDSYRENNLGIAAGVRTMNSTNTYPQLETWRKLDPSGSYEDVYNRYAHVLVNLVEAESDEPLFALEAPDAFTLNAAADQLAAIGVTNLYSRDGNLERFSTEAVSVASSGQAGPFYLYSLHSL